MASEYLAHCTQHPKWDAMGRVVIENIYPELNCGRYPVKRLVGDKVEIWADIFCDGHDALGAAVKYRHEKEKEWRRAPMRFFDNDRWVGAFELTQAGRYLFTIEAWIDMFESWRRNFHKKREAGQDTSLEIREGCEILEMSLGAAPEDITGPLRPELDQAHASPEGLEELLLSPKDSRPDGGSWRPGECDALCP